MSQEIIFYMRRYKRPFLLATFGNVLALFSTKLHSATFFHIPPFQREQDII